MMREEEKTEGKGAEEYKENKDYVERSRKEGLRNVSHVTGRAHAYQKRT